MELAGKLLDRIAFSDASPKAGDYVKAQRRILGLRRNDLAFITGISVKSLSAYENNRKKMRTKTAEKLGAALNLDPVILLESNKR